MAFKTVDFQFSLACAQCTLGDNRLIFCIEKQYYIHMEGSVRLTLVQNQEI